MSGSRWVITALRLSESWRSFLYNSSVCPSHLFWVSSASVRSIPLLSFIVPIYQRSLHVMQGRTGASLTAQTVKNLPAMRETWVPALGWEDPWEEGVATHSSPLAWRIPWTEEPVGLESMGLQRVRHDWVSKHTQGCIVCNFYTQDSWEGVYHSVNSSFVCRVRWW